MKQKLGIAFLIIAIAATSWYLLKHDTAPAPPETPVESQKTSQSPQPEVTTETEFDMKRYSTEDVTSIWVVVNKRRPLNPQNYAPSDLVAVGSQRLRTAAAEALSSLMNDAKKEGLTISPLSGYRSYNTQVIVYNNEVATNGQAVADTQSARPGTSEHQTGLSIDVGGGGCGIEDCFANTKEGKWLAANSYKYGFIIRYPEGKQAVTGYRYEPWHIRYVGSDLSTEMKTRNVSTLEEFFGLPAAPTY